MRLVNPNNPPLAKAALAFGAVTLGLALAACGGDDAKNKPKGPPPAREVQVLKLAPTEVRETGEYLGTLVSRQTVRILPQVGGYVRKIHVKPGQKVPAGMPLLEVDARQESAAVDSAQAAVRSAQSNLELARQTLTRTEQLYKEGLVSAQELERTRAASAAAEAAMASAAAQATQRQVQLAYYAVRAPIAGTVGDVLARVGDFVNTTTQLTSISDADALEVSVAIPAERARQVSPGTPIELLDPQGEVMLTAPVYFVAPQADPRTQLVEVKGAFQNHARLRPNELLRVRLVYSTRQALQVPALAVVRMSGQPFVFGVSEKDGKTVVERRPVTLGTLGAQSYVVEKGLSAGDRIAVSALQSLRDNAEIKPVAASASGRASADASPPPDPKSTGAARPN